MEELKWQPKSPLITSSELPHFSTLHRVLVLHCGAVWNGQDTRLDERLQPLRHEFAPRLGIYAIDIENIANFPLLHEAKVLTVPALVCMIGGIPQRTNYGVPGEALLRTHFQAWLAIADAKHENAPM